jgi:hypothetical protein
LRITFAKKSWISSKELSQKLVASLVYTIAYHETLNPMMGWDDVIVHKGIIFASGGHTQVAIDYLSF